MWCRSGDQPAMSVYRRTHTGSKTGGVEEGKEVTNPSANIKPGYVRRVRNFPASEEL